MLTRVSVVEDDPDRLSAIRQRHVFITLDGKVVHDVVTADSVAGIVLVYDFDAPMFAEGIATALLYGNVRIYSHKPRWWPTKGPHALI